MDASVEERTRRVQAFYERHPYPGLGAALPLAGARRLAQRMEAPGRVLYPGCGTCHGAVAMAKVRPGQPVFGLDLSQPSLDVGRELARLHGVPLELAGGDYTCPLPWDLRFRYIVLLGTLHHCADPAAALTNLGGCLEPDGLLYVNLYGKKYHQRRFEIIEMLDLLQAGRVDVLERFELYRALVVRQRRRPLYDRLMELSARQVVAWLRGLARRAWAPFARATASVPWTTEFTRLDQLWMDSFCHPHELTFTIPEFRALLERTGFDVVEMLSLGRVERSALPERWLLHFDRLEPFTRYRIMELYWPTAGSIGAWLRPRR